MGAIRSLFLSFLSGAGLILFSLTSPAYSQSTFATLTGTVYDPGGAVVSGAVVEATHVQTNYRHAARSNESGVYVLAQLLDGGYHIRVRAAGFKEFLARDVQLAARDLRRLDVRLELGAVETVVEVVAGATLIETETARITDTKVGDLLNRLPMNTRSPRSLVAQTAGVYIDTGVTGVSTIRYAGSRTNQEETAVDGISVRARDSSSIGPQVQYLESVQELRVDMANNTAEFGALGQMTIISKSGGNRLRGSVFDYYSTTAFYARNPFSLTRPSQVRHWPGASLGGPVYLPRLYKGKDKTFFFFTYETTRGGAVGQTWRNTYAPVGWRSGDFSRLAPATAIRDPFGGNAPFPANRIPAARLNPVALKVQERFFPLPNVGDPEAFATNNFFQLKYRSFDPNPMWTARIDHRFSPRAFVFGRYAWTRTPSLTWESSLPTVEEFRWQQRDTRHVAFSYTHTISNALLNEARYGYAFTDSPRYGPVMGKPLVRELGLIGLVDDLPDIRGILNVGWSGIGLTGLTQQAYRVPGFLNRVQQVQDHVSWIRGKHNTKFGASLRRTYHGDTTASSNLFGNLTFSNRFAGHPYADFLLGIPTTARRAFPPLGDNQFFWHYEFFATDDYKITRNLTLNLGVRYEYTPGFNAPDGRQSSFDVDTGKIVVPDGLLGKVSPLLPRGYVDVIEASRAGFRNPYLISPDANNFAPRAGMAYRPWGDTTVFRGGFGVFYDVTPHRLPSSIPFSVAEPDYTNPTTNPQVILPRVFPATVGGPTTVSLPVAVNPGLVIPYSMQYSFTIEHQRWNNAFRMSYIGTNTRKGIWTYNINQPLPDNRPYVDKPRRFPLYPAVTYLTGGAGHQYHSLTLEARRQWSRGLSYHFSWVWARDIGDLEQRQSPENAYDRRRERGVWNDIPTHRITSHLIYQLPFGRGKPLSSGNRWLDTAISGWEITAVYLLHSGRFLTPQWSGPDPTGTAHTASRTPANVTIRPNHLRNANLPSGERRLTRWFDPSAFTPPTPGSFGTAARGTIIGPGTNVLHSGIAREFALPGERARLRCELTGTNILNHPNWGNPGVNISTLGSVGVISSVGGAGGDDAAGARALRAGIRLEW